MLDHGARAKSPDSPNGVITVASKPKPSIRERARDMICPECGKPVERKSKFGPAPIFCAPLPGAKRSACQVAHQNRHIAEGRAVIALLKAWRIDRGSGEIAQESFAQASAIIDLFNAQDRDAGRPRPDLFAAKMLADGSIYLDRRAN